MQLSRNKEFPPVFVRGGLYLAYVQMCRIESVAHHVLLSFDRVHTVNFLGFSWEAQLKWQVVPVNCRLL
jgi:hypothetical protein